MSFVNAQAERLLSVGSALRIVVVMIAQRWGRSLETSVINLSCAGLSRISGFRLGLSLVFVRASIVGPATAILRSSPAVASPPPLRNICRTFLLDIHLRILRCAF
jgi:hypothetical protein